MKNWVVELKKLVRGSVQENIPLSEFAAYRIGGPAEAFVEPSIENVESYTQDILSVLRFCESKKIPLRVLGSGTNLLISDKGLKGVVLYLGPRLRAWHEIVFDDGNDIYLNVAAHMAKATLLDLALENAWAGLEFSAGIPGTLGGAVFMNAGTKWGAYADVVQAVSFASVEKGIFSLNHESIGFKYRGHGEGIFSSGALVLSVLMRLQVKKSSQESRELVDSILKERGSKQPLELPNCGSVFKNPTGSERGAGRLIEASDLKGYRVGNAEISLKHANFILNRGGAKSSDVRAIIAHAQKTVREKFSIFLEPEVIFWE